MKYRCRYAGQRKELKTYVGVTVCLRPGRLNMKLENSNV
jgi:hypothetical protein